MLLVTAEAQYFSHLACIKHLLCAKHRSGCIRPSASAVSPPRNAQGSRSPFSVPGNKGLKGQGAKGLEKGRKKPGTRRGLLLYAAHKEVYSGAVWLCDCSPRGGGARDLWIRPFTSLSLQGLPGA